MTTAIASTAAIEAGPKTQSAAQPRPGRLAAALKMPGRLVDGTREAAARLGGFGIALLALYPVLVVLAIAVSILVFAAKHGPI